MIKKVKRQSHLYSDVLEDIPSIAELQNALVEWNINANEIKSNFNFAIPDYILDEIMKQQYCHNKDNLYALINCAVINGNITPENAKKIKNMYF